ncbi:MAG TPA: universal stress protein [Steroidobacteraceae bacterium]|nr:universal stress protein [Steroidobacteraceae bacterium]
MPAPRSQSIMVAIRSIDRTSIPLIRKAAELAKRFNASLRFVHVIPLAIGSGLRPAVVSQALAHEIDSSASSLGALCRKHVSASITCTVDVVCGYPPGDVIAQLALRHRPLFVLAASNTHARIARIWLSNTDWELLRKCHCPVWLSKRNESQTSRVLAAVDPFHERAKPTGLDDRIVRRAIELAGSPRRVQLVHCYAPPQTIMVSAGVEAYWIPLPEADRKKLARQIRRRLQRLADRYEIPAANIVLHEGEVELELPSLARSLKADLTVMGAISRSGVKKIFFGNTAEKVIDRMACDVVVVKPRGFKLLTQLERTRRLNRPSRTAARSQSAAVHA